MRKPSCRQTVANPAKVWLCPSIRRCCPSREKDLLTILDSHPTTCHIVPDFAPSGRMWTPTSVFVDLSCIRWGKYSEGSRSPNGGNRGVTRGEQVVLESAVLLPLKVRRCVRRSGQGLVGS
ncbi:hypothetical protein Ancab_024480 [Ancistrocladus abbreviatus]